jgi:hypothetical protein
MLLLKSRANLFLIPTVSVLYFFTVVYLMNWSLINQTFLGSYPLNYKFKLISLLLTGVVSAVGIWETLFLGFISILLSINIVLILDNLKTMRKIGGNNFYLSSGFVLSSVSGGCLSCGLPLISFLGLGGVLLYLPFKGVEVLFMSVILLIFSIFSLVRTKQVSCRIN